MNYNLSKKTKSKNQTKEIKVLPLLLVFIVSLFFLSSPFIHMAYNDKPLEKYVEGKAMFKKGEISAIEYEQIRSENTYFGYKTKRKFLYAIGKPMLLIFISLLMLYTSMKLKEKYIKQIVKYISVISSMISFYFLIWAFWYRADFPKNLYYISIGVLSVFSVFILYKTFQLLEYLKYKKEQRIEANEDFISATFKTIDTLNAKIIQ